MWLNRTLAATRRKPEHFKYNFRHASDWEELNPLNSAKFPIRLFGSGWVAFVVFVSVVETESQLLALRGNAFWFRNRIWIRIQHIMDGKQW
jgi:hypothetical protein